ncbi:MAG: LamG domain-containing protein, partial [Limisphaerales bacterium]
PTNWPVTGSIYVDQYLNNSYFIYSANVATTQTNWTVPVPIPASNPGSYSFVSLDYVTNYTSDLFVATTPTNILNGAPVGLWSYNSILESGGQVSFTVAAPPASSTNHTLVAHYSFDNSGDLGMDSSTNGNDLECGSSWGDNNYQQFTTDAEIGGGAVQFFGESSMTPCDGSPIILENWTNALLGSFTVSAWINTTNVVGNDNDQLDDGDGQTVVYVNNNGNGVIPLGITGTKAAIATGVAPGASGQDTLNSSGTVTSGSYVQVVVTRDAGSGLKQIYINGVLDSSDYGEPGILDGGANYASIGGELSAPYTGNLDDVQIYSGVLSATEVAALYASGGTDFNTALGTTNLNWSTSGDSNWFAESTNTYNGSSSAAQSGSVISNQASVLSVTVNGPGTLTFAWSSIANDPNQGFDYEFDIDGNDAADLYGNNGWNSETDPNTDQPFVIPAGQHTLTWTVYANGDTDPTQAGFLDQVSLLYGSAPVITLNPFSQTNYPGYSVALLAAATSNPTATWQWFQVGSALPIPN